jgi:DNA invertase Pin-like site-specific DNA recombinase
MEFETSGDADPAPAGKGRMRIGYARVSKREQNLGLQRHALKSAGCHRIFVDKVSALDTTRPGLMSAIAAISPGDQLVIWKLDRFARDLLDQLLLLRELQLRGGSLVTLTEVIDTGDWMGDVMSRQLALYAEVELKRIRERTRAGVKFALANGVRFGRRPKLTPAQVRRARRLVKGGKKVETVAEDFGVGRSTMFRYLAQADSGAISRLPRR